MNMTSSGLQCEVEYWPAMTLGGAAQVAAAHCPNERTLDPAVCNYNRLATFSKEYYQIVATHLPTPKGWKAELAWAPWV